MKMLSHISEIRELADTGLRIAGVAGLLYLVLKSEDRD